MSEGTATKHPMRRLFSSRRGLMAGAAALLGAGLAKLGNAERVEAGHNGSTPYSSEGVLHVDQNNTTSSTTAITMNPGVPDDWGRFAFAAENKFPGLAPGNIPRRGLWGTVLSSGTSSSGVEGQAQSTTGLTNGVSGYNFSATDNSRGVFGYSWGASGVTVGVWGETLSTTSNTCGVYGTVTGTSGSTVGVWGRSQSPSGKGIYGENVATTGQTTGVGGQVSSTGNFSIGVSGAALGASGETYGVTGATFSSTTNATGVKGVTYNGTTYGVWGQTFSTTNIAIGVFGQAAGSTGDTFGVWGRSQSSSPNAVGVYGHVTASTNGTGVKGAAAYGPGVHGLASGGHGVRGEASFGIGVMGIGGGSGAGIYGTNTSTGPAAQFVGNVIVQGGFTVTGGPKSAAVKKRDGTQVRVYCQESPEPWFEDFGTAEIKGGQAAVALDPEFDEVVKGDDYRVFLTEIGDCGGLYVSRTGPHRFEVKSRAGAAGSGSFYYRIVARRADPVGGRLEKVNVPAAIDPKSSVAPEPALAEQPGMGNSQQPKPERPERPTVESSQPSRTEGGER